MYLTRFNHYRNCGPQSGWDKQGTAADVRVFTPRADVGEDEANYYINLAVPGLKKEDFKVEVANSLLTISGERKFEQNETGPKFHRVENRYGEFSRSFRLPEDAKTTGITASYTDGVLAVVVPKDEVKQASSTIEVK